MTAILQQRIDEWDRKMNPMVATTDEGPELKLACTEALAESIIRELQKLCAQQNEALVACRGKLSVANFAATGINPFNDRVTEKALFDSHYAIQSYTAAFGGK